MSTTRPKSPTNERIDALPPAPTVDALQGPRADLARAIPRRTRVSWWLGIVLAAAFAVVVTPAITAERWLSAIGVGEVVRGQPAPLTIRVAPFAGHDTAIGHTGGGGVLIAKGETADRDAATAAGELRQAQPHGPIPYVAFLLLVGVLAGLFTHHTRRSTQGRLLRVQLVSLGLIVATAVVVKLVMLSTALSVLVVPVAVFAMVPTLVLDRVVGLATGTLAALVVAFLVPFDVGVAVMLMVQAGAAGLVIAERPKRSLRAILIAGGAATLFTAATYPLMLYLSAGKLPLAELGDPLHSAWLASAIGPAIATALTIVCVPLYQLAVGEITRQKLVELEELSHPLLKQIASRAPGTWQHSLTMANMAELAANAIGANGRLVRVGAYFHDLGKSLNPKYFIENLEPGETSPHDKLPPETSCDAIFRHVTEGIVAARKAGLHERIIDFMHMHHGNGVLEYFWARCREQGNTKGLSVEHFRYPGVPPQSRETAILSITDAVEAAARTLKSPDVTSIDRLVQRIVYGKLHVGQLDESGLSMSDLRRITESLRETIRHANHGRIEYPWQKAQQDASAPPDREKLTQTGPRLDSLDRPARPESVHGPVTPDSSELAMRTTAPLMRQETHPGQELPAQLAVALTGPLPTDNDATRPAPKFELDETHPTPKTSGDDVVELRFAKPKAGDVPAPGASDGHLQRITNPVGERVQNPRIDSFAADAVAALAEATKDSRATTSADDQPTGRSSVVEMIANEPAPAARKRAATLPPIKPPTVPPPPLGRRAPTLQPFPALRPPTEPPNVTAPPPGALRPPAATTTLRAGPTPGNLRPPAPPSTPPAPPTSTVPPPSAVRPPGMNYLEDMITLRPQYEPKPELRVTHDEDGSVLIEPSHPRLDDDPGSTQPSLPAIGDTTDASVPLPEAERGASTWARSLAARLDAQLDEDFGTETPIVAPTRAELQALLNSPLDATRQQSLEEIERLHREALDRPSQPELELTRRAQHPTAEVDESDIEAAIELAPPSRRSAIGIAKKKHED